MDLLHLHQQEVSVVLVFRCLQHLEIQQVVLEHLDQILVDIMLVVVEMVVDIHLLETLLSNQPDQLVVVDMVLWMRVCPIMVVLVVMVYIILDLVVVERITANLLTQKELV